MVEETFFGVYQERRAKESKNDVKTMTERDFNTDLSNSNTPEIRFAWESWFINYFSDNITIQWKDDKNIQLGLGTDITITKRARRYSVELKTRCHKVFGQPWIVEVVHHRYDRLEKPRTKIETKDGWIYTTTAEYIAHATLNEKRDAFLEVIMYSTMPFKLEKYRGELGKLSNLFLTTKLPNGLYQITVNKLISKEKIIQDANEHWYYRVQP